MAMQFNVYTDMVDVTSNNRPDTSWLHIDPLGHVHQWFTPDGQPALMYTPESAYTLPTLDWIVDVEATDEYPERGHYECLICRAMVQPGRCADAYVQKVPGLRHCTIDGQSVSREVFEREWAIEQARLKGL